jgi:tRNA(adenine34) deaminase
MYDHQHWMQMALALADKAQALGEVPVGAVLVRDSKIIGQGFNQPIMNHDPSAHAEIIALREAGKAAENYRLVDTTMYVTLEPCAMCAMAMVHARVSHLVYAAPEPRTGAAGSLYQLLRHNGHNHQIEITCGILEQQSAERLKAFFRARRKSSKTNRPL